MQLSEKLLSTQFPCASPSDFWSRTWKEAEIGSVHLQQSASMSPLQMQMPTQPFVHSAMSSVERNQMTSNTSISLSTASSMPTTSFETDIYVEDSENGKTATAPVNFAVQALLQMPQVDLLCHIDLPPDREPVLFDVEPNKYPLQPWLRAAQFLKQAKTQEQAELASRQLRQWFNYNLTPESFVEYAVQQRGVRKMLSEARDGRLPQSNGF